MTASKRVKLKPGDTIGILGGGQLGRMLAMAAARLGLKCQVFSPDPDSPAFDVVLNATCAEYADVEALELFANDVDVITYEFENVPAATATVLAATGRVRSAKDRMRRTQASSPRAVTATPVTSATCTDRGSGPTRVATRASPAPDSAVRTHASSVLSACRPGGGPEDITSPG